MPVLTTKPIYVTPPIPSTPPPITIQFVKPLSYEFRVAEVVDKDGKIISVKLQMQVYEHDEYGSSIVKQYWSDVPRYKFDETGEMIHSIP